MWILKIEKRDIVFVLATFFGIAIAGMLNAGMDTLRHHYDQSIFAEWNFPGKDYWKEDWKKKWETDPITGELLYDEDGNRIRRFWMNIRVVPFNHPLWFDGWHMIKAVMVEIIILIFIFRWFYRKQLFKQKLWHYVVSFLILNIIYALGWNLSFNYFYETGFIK